MQVNKIFKMKQHIYYIAVFSACSTNANSDVKSN